MPNDTPPSSDLPPTPQSLLAAAQQTFAQRDYAAAGRRAEQAGALFKRAPDDQQLTQATIAHLLGTLLAEQGDLARAEQGAGGALELARRWCASRVSR